MKIDEYYGDSDVNMIMENKSDKYFAKGLFILTYWIIIVYNFHKYIFKYASSTTSPTYSDTPFIWKMSKYIIIGLLLGSFYSISKFKKKGTKQFFLLLGLFGLLLIFNILHFVITHDVVFDELAYIIFFIFTLPFYFIDIDKIVLIDKIIENSYSSVGWVLSLSNLFAIGNFIFFGRLTALAYRGSSIRFGGFWDDPNGFSILSVFLFFINFNKKNYLLCALLFINIALAFSITGYIIFIISFLFWMQRELIIFKKKFLFVFISLFGALLFLGYKYYYLIDAFWKLKSRSIDEHTSYTLNLSNLPGMLGTYYFSETWYYSFLLNYFPVSVVALLICLYTILKLFGFTNSRSNVEYYIFIFLLSCIFLPVFYYFPLNILFFIYLPIYIRRNEIYNFGY